ncbi:cysteine-rich receptor-like protein kinase 2 [Quercus robur]|uniref:cysteine-rich receptor-like protein kinase 2 n=1 Tax=Quercus robur TaxID=38942 RepID=UPI0021639C1A|nr:cysteine-rich receptor-like protein kinase 2 [Quercus robur]
MKKDFSSVPSRCFILAIINTSLLLQTATADPRTQMVQITCGHQLVQNRSVTVSNFGYTMENIRQQMQGSGFGVAVTGSGPDTNYGLGQCYGDLSLPDCELCYAEARTALPQCFPHTSGRIYFDGCFLRSENYSFFEEYTGPGDSSVCGNTTRKNSTFEESVKKALSSAVVAAPHLKSHAIAQEAVPRAVNESAYALADCWRTLNASSCKVCLENASASILECLPWSEGRVLNTGCFMRYSDKDFLNKELGTQSSKGRTTVIIVSIVSSLVLVVIGIAVGLYIWRQRSIAKKRRGSNDAEKLVKILNDISLNFKYSTLEKATGGFDIANKLGQGGFGTVYKGTLPDGREIAVKRLFSNKRHRAEDFYNEVNIISSVEHKNLVRLLGCSCSGPESLLVYEFLPNTSLDRFIFDPNKGKALNWDKRYEIIVGTTAGLAYLHDNSTIKIIHRDIKASNILLDSKFRAKIADFGLARSLQENQSHVSTAIAGTLGYMPPEYLVHGQLTEKVDVYSFGVLLLEIVTGRQNNRTKTIEYSSDCLNNLITITWKHFRSGTVEQLYDPNLLLHNHPNDNVKNEILRVVHIGLLCTQKIQSLRPTMSKALQMLTKKDDHLPAPTKPPFIDESMMKLTDKCEDPCNPLKAGDSASIATISDGSFCPR